MAQTTIKVPTDQVQLDPTQTIVGINWADSFYVMCVRYVGSGGATGTGGGPGSLPVNAPVAFGDYDHYPSGFIGDMTNLELDDDALAFFKSKRSAQFLPESVCFTVNGSTWWYFQEIPADNIQTENILDSSICFGTGVGSISNYFKLLKKMPETPEGETGFTIQQLIDAEPFFEDTPADQSVSTNRWTGLNVHLREETADENGRHPALDPPTVEWTT